MANLSIRNIPDKTKEILRVQAAKSGVSLEAHVRNILQDASTTEAKQLGVMELAGKYFGSKCGVDLELPSRSSSREKVDFTK